MIIESLLETDLYKFTMWQTLLHRHPATQAEYTFVCRNTPIYPLADLAEDVERELDALCTLTFRAEELDYLRSLRFMASDFVDFLRIFRLQREFIHVSTHGPALQIVARGPQVHVMSFEIYVLAIVNELYFRRFPQAEAMAEGRRRLAGKIDRLQRFASGPAKRHPFDLFEFGLRRRFSAAMQREVVSGLQRAVPSLMKGTSNVALAKELGLAPIGTMAHEYLQTFQALGVQLRSFQKTALQEWVEEYRGDLGIALTDVVGMDAFLRDFDLFFAKLFDGLRHDSGDPFEWGEKALAHYQRLRIDPHQKRLVFSDALDLDRAFALYEHFGDRTQLGFGIGTHLSNDVGIKPLNIVMKLTRANGQPVAKLSDSPGKTLCDDLTFLAYLRQVFGIVEPVS